MSEISSNSQSAASLLAELLENHQSTILVKVLSKNDHSWADDKGKHQAGVYIPATLRNSGFLPSLKKRDDKPHIFDADFLADWPQVSAFDKEAHLVHYSNKGPETHLTRVPMEIFKQLGPSSLLIGLKKTKPSASGGSYTFLVIDSLFLRLRRSI